MDEAKGDASGKKEVIWRDVYPLRKVLILGRYFGEVCAHVPFLKNLKKKYTNAELIITIYSFTTVMRLLLWLGNF